MILPHCTWDKFGELMASSGGRSLGLFDELLSFFTSMNMYSSNKNQVSDTKEYQDFLSLHTGKQKTRVTLTGNANFNIERTSFSLLGFTQPHSAIPIVQDIANNVKGFTSRILWMFPKPVYSKYEDSKLTPEEIQDMRILQEELVDVLATLYIHGEKTFRKSEDGKIQCVDVKSTPFIMSKDAEQHFAKVHDSWEFEICEKYEHDPIIGGLYSRGKSQLLRLAVPVHILLNKFSFEKDHNKQCDKESELPATQPGPSNLNSKLQSNDQNDKQCDKDGEPATSQPGPSNLHSELQLDDQDIDNDDHTEEKLALTFETDVQVSTEVSIEALLVSESIVRLCLKQLCIMLQKLPEEGNVQQEQTSTPSVSNLSGLNKLVRTVLCSSGKIVSFSVLSNKGVFRKGRHNLSTSGKPLAREVANIMKTLELGEIEEYEISSNKSIVIFFIKKEPPSDKDQAMAFGTKLAKHGVTFQQFKEFFEQINEESEKSLEDYQRRLQAPPTPTSRAITPSSRKRKLFEEEDEDQFEL